MVSMLIVVTVIVLAFFGGLLWLFMLIDALRTPSAAWSASGQSQILYVLMMIFLGIVGTFLYLLIAAPAISRAAKMD